jgi:protein-tyrosine phosphatase
MLSGPAVRFVRVGRGRLALYHRPGREDFPAFRRKGCTHVVTLLKDIENSELYGQLTKEAGMEWYWLPVPNGKFPQTELHQQLMQALPELSRLLDEGKSLLIHCSAGVHRTGMVTYGLLRWRGVESAQAMKLIRRMRRETAEGMMEKRMKWGDGIAQTIQTQDRTWIASAKEFVNRWLTKIFKPR